MRDGAEIDARFEQVNSGAVAQAVWVDSFAFKRRQSCGVYAELGIGGTRPQWNSCKRESIAR